VCRVRIDTVQPRVRLGRERSKRLAALRPSSKNPIQVLALASRDSSEVVSARRGWTGSQECCRAVASRLPAMLCAQPVSIVVALIEFASRILGPGVAGL
jgi:hypothetical protein